MAQLFTLPQQVRLNSSGAPYASAKAYFYRANTLTAQAVYTTPALTRPHAQPVQADSAGQFPPIWLDSEAAYDYRVIVKTSAEVQLDDYEIQRSSLTETELSEVLTPDLLGRELYPTTDAEDAALVTPTNHGYPEGDLRRYGATGDGVADDSAAWQSAVSVGKVYIPEGSFRIVTGATRTGRVSIRGEGITSKLLCDSTVLTVTTGTGSSLDNFYAENITAPYIITRDASDWAAAPVAATSNDDGYQPTSNDADVWSGLTTDQQNQQIGPKIYFTGNATDIEVSRIYGRFVLVEIRDARRSVARDCNFRGGKGTWGAIVFDNYTNGNQSGEFNKAINNHIRYASFSGICFLNNTDGLAEGNTVQLCGESGVKTAQGSGISCANMTIIGNKCNRNYHDGVDAASRFPLDDTQITSHLVANNECYGNGGTGMNADGLRNSYLGNKLWNNYKYGFWGLCSDSLIANNLLIDNNQDRDSNWHEMLGGNTGNTITGNRIYAGAGNNSYGIYAANTHFIVGNYVTGSDVLFGSGSYTAGNVAPNLPYLKDQSFVFAISNNAGTLQHAIYGESGAVALGNYADKINGATSASTNTPTGADGSTAMAGGGKIGSANTNHFWFDTASQDAANSQMLATVVYNDTATAGIIVRPQLVSLDINGVTRTRLTFQFLTSAGVAHALTTANIAAGKSIQVQFLGKLA